MSARVVVIGSANVDFVMRSRRLPARGETVTDAVFLQTFGGKGANQAVAAARAGAATTFVAALGHDLYAGVMVENFRRDGIGVDHIAVEDDIPSGSALVMVDSVGDNYLMVAPGSNHRVNPERVAAAEPEIAACDWVVLQMEIPIAANVAALELAARHGKPVLLNYAPAVDFQMPREERTHGLVVNEAEAGALLGRPLDPAHRGDACEAAVALRAAGHAFAIVTLGAGGVAVCDQAGARDFPAFRVTPCDATAAGDTFCGALVTALGEGRGLDDAIGFASAAAALAVSRPGAQPSIPARSEIDAFLKSATL